MRQQPDYRGSHHTICAVVLTRFAGIRLARPFFTSGVTREAACAREKQTSASRSALRGKAPLSLLSMSNTTPFGYPIPAARRISPLRQRMIEDMTVRNFAPNTQDSYLSQVSLFARHFGKSPEQLGPEEIRAYQIYLAEQKKVSVSTRIVVVSALRFFYAVTLRRNWTVQLIPTPKKDHRLPVILSPQEVLELLQAAPSFTHHVIFSTMYGTGMRVSEALHLRAANIDGQRMMIRIELSKGHKDRDVQLSVKLLELLRCYWRKARPGEWMFPGQNPDQPLTRDAVEG